MSNFLESRPSLCGGAALLVTLRGVAIQEDKYKEQREKLEVHNYISDIL